MHTLFHGVVAAGLLVQAGASAPTEGPGEPDPLVGALLNALETYDRSVRSIEWGQLVYCPPVPGSWQLKESRRAGVDELGAWYAESEFPACDEVGTGNAVRLYQVYPGADERLFTYDIGYGRGKVAAPAGNEMSGITTPLHLMGRFVDFDAGRPLYELLARCRDLNARSSQDAKGLPSLSGVATMGGHDFSIEVSLDPDHGYAPRRIRVRKVDPGCPLETVETVRYTECDGVWIPSVGVRGLYMLLSKSRTPDDAAAIDRAIASFARSRELAGLPNLDTDLRESLREAVADCQEHGDTQTNPDSIYIPLSAGSSPGPPVPEIVLAEVHHVNRELPRPDLWLPVPPGRTLFDFFREKRGSSDEVVRPLQLRETKNAIAKPAK